MVQIVKVDTSDDPAAPTPSWENYNEGERNPGRSLPVEYTMTGKITGNLRVGHMMTVKRKTRNGEEALGFMRTSAIERIKHDGDVRVVETQNSIYRITPVTEDN